MAGISGAVSFGAYGYLQIASFYDSGDEKVAKLRLIHDIAENFKFLTILIDPLIEDMVVCSGYHQRRAGEVLFGIFRFYQFGVCADAQACERPGDIVAKHHPPGAGVEKGFGLSDSDGSAAYNNHAPSG